MKRSITVFMFFCYMFFSAIQGSAEDGISLGLGLSADILAYKNYDMQWAPRPIINLESCYFYINGFDAGIYLIKGEVVTLAALASYNDFSFSPSNSSDKKIRRLKKRHSTVLGGLELGLLTPAGLFQASGVWDLLSQSDGFDCYFSWSGMLEAGPVKIFPSIGLNWQSSKYVDYYYGVSQKEAAISGFKAYKAGSGWTPYADLAFDLKLSDKWDFLLLLETEMLGDAIKDSPLVNKNFTFGATAGLIYTF